MRFAEDKDFRLLVRSSQLGGIDVLMTVIDCGQYHGSIQG